MVSRQWNRAVLVVLIVGVVIGFAVMSIGVAAQDGADFSTKGGVQGPMSQGGGIAGAAAEDNGNSNSAVQPRPNEEAWWTERQQQVNERVAEGNVDLVFVGDSITHGWEGAGKPVWDKYYGGRNAVNLGFSGDRTEQVLWRLDNGNVAGIRPKLAVVMIGTNNFRTNTAEEIGAGVTAVVERLREKLPDTKVLLLAIFPRNETPDEVREKLQKASEIASKTAEDPMVRYLDINAAFLDDDGTLPKEVMPDLLHPVEPGYELWAEMIEPHVAEMLGEVDDFEPLFNGTDLTGWEQVGGDEPVWFAHDGILYTDGKEGGGWLSTKRQYGDFVLELEFRVPENGNSGVFIRAPREGNPAFAGNEIQVLDDYGPVYVDMDLKPYQYTGSLYSTEAPERRVTKPAGEWQTMRIYAQGPVVRVTLNDVLVTIANQDEHPEKLEEHPGLKRYEGYIGLQNHDTRLDYRNLRIREIAYD